MTEYIASPSLIHQLQTLLAKYPKAKWIQYEPVGRGSAHEGLRTVFGSAVQPVYHFEKAAVVLSLDNDFLFCGPGSVRYSRDFMERRRDVKAMNRLYSFQSYPSNTGAVADHCFPVRPSEVGAIAATIGEMLGLGIKAGASLTDAQTKWAAAIAHDLKQNAGASLVLAGDTQPPQVHALAHALNHFLGNEGKTVVYTDSLEADTGNENASLRALAKDWMPATSTHSLSLAATPSIICLSMSDSKPAFRKYLFRRT